jgi:chemotaxis protein methyltransferase CheR
MSATATATSREFEYTRADFDHLRRLSNAHTGIVVPDDKFNMFYSRLAKRLRALGLSSFKEYCHYLEAEHDTEFTAFINAITTNLTSFFREQHHFDFLKQTAIPEFLANPKQERRIRIWSAGCSTGEEPYSIAMTLRERIPNISSWDIKILATDIDSDVLETAGKGVYAIKGKEVLNDVHLKKWFLKGSNANSGKARARNELQELIAFKQLNLLSKWPMKHSFDIVFCRNVLIYFDAELKQSLTEKFTHMVRPGGYLIIGHSESIGQWASDLKLIGKTIYQRVR